MDIVWDPSKAKTNVARHGVRFSDVEPVFNDLRALTIEDAGSFGEQRFVTIGSDGFGRVLVVAYTYRADDAIRVISARIASSRERKLYEEGV
jgi:uncharacterized DUF497 family protein